MPPKKTNKTARRTTGKPGEFIPAADISRIVPLNSGRNAYVCTLTGKTRHMSTSSDEFITLIASMDSEGRITRELNALAERYPDNGWDAVAERVAVEAFMDAAATDTEDAAG